MYLVIFSTISLISGGIAGIAKSLYFSESEILWLHFVEPVFMLFALTFMLLFLGDIFFSIFT